VRREAPFGKLRVRCDGRKLKGKGQIGEYESKKEMMESKGAEHESSREMMESNSPEHESKRELMESNSPEHESKRELMESNSAEHESSREMMESEGAGMDTSTGSVQGSNLKTESWPFGRLRAGSWQSAVGNRSHRL
jgi:hypothetical protein